MVAYHIINYIIIKTERVGVVQSVFIEWIKLMKREIDNLLVIILLLCAFATCIMK